jgi:tetratricopeptide (TPR) repeat protein
MAQCLLLGCTTRGLLASTPEAAVYNAFHEQDGAVLLVFFETEGDREQVRQQLPRDRLQSDRWLLPPERKCGLVVMGPDRMGLLVNGLWEWGRGIINRPGGGRGLHYSHNLDSQLVSQAMKGLRGLRVRSKTLEPREVKGSGFFSIALGARQVGAGGEAGAEDVAVKVFLGQGSQKAFEAEVRTLQMLTVKISPAALVVRLVGVVEASEGGALPWPALVMTPLCVESLEQRIDRFASEPYTLGEVVAWAGQVALSLHRLHRESRLRHGDVTLRNVLLGRDGRAYLADMGVAEHNHPYGRQSQQKIAKGKSASVAPEMVQGRSSPSSDARADVWSWGVLLHALLTRSTATAKGGSVSAYLTMMENGRWWWEVAMLWEAEGLPRGVLEAVRHSLCERGERVGLLAGAVMLGQEGLVEEMVGGMEAPEEVKEAELDIARQEARVVVLSGEGSSPAERRLRAALLIALAVGHEAVGDETQAIVRMRGQILYMLGGALVRRGHYQEAAGLLEQCIDMWRRLLPEDHPDIATSLNNLANCHHHQSEYGKALLLHEEALAMRRRLLPEDHPDIAASLSNVANCHLGQGEYGKAALLHEEALAMRRRLLPEDHPDIAASLSNLASCHVSQGECDKAVLLYDKALAMRRQLPVGDHPGVAGSLSNLADCHASQGEYGKALSLHEEALAMRRRLLPEDHPHIAGSLSNLANCHFSQGEYGKALSLHEEALAMRRRRLPEDHPDIGDTMALVGVTLAAVDDCAGTMRHYEQAIAILSKSLPSDHPKLRSLVEGVQLCRAELSVGADRSPAPAPGSPAPSTQTEGSHPSGPTAPAPGAGVVDWSSRSVGELKAFLRSRGVDLRGLLERHELVLAATATAAEGRRLSVARATPLSADQAIVIGLFLLPLEGLLTPNAGGCSYFLSGLLCLREVRDPEFYMFYSGHPRQEMKSCYN